MTRPEAAIQAWFNGLNEGDVEATVSLFDPAFQSIKNAANPPIAGPEAARRLLEEFFRRTSGRRFRVLTVARGNHARFAHWTAELSFADGASVGGHVVEPFTVEIEGVDTFVFNDVGQIVNVQIMHETTTVAMAAAANAKEETTR